MLAVQREYRGGADVSVCGRWLRMCERGCRCDECEFEDKEEEEDDDDEEKVEEKARKWFGGGQLKFLRA